MLFAMVAGHLPFDSSRQLNSDTLIRFYRRIVTSKMTFPTKFSEDLCDLIAKMLTPKPEERIDAFAILNHPWLLRHTSNCKIL